MTGKTLGNWLLGALSALVILALVSAFAPLPKPTTAPAAPAAKVADGSAPSVADAAVPQTKTATDATTGTAPAAETAPAAGTVATVPATQIAPDTSQAPAAATGTTDAPAVPAAATTAPDQTAPDQTAIAPDPAQTADLAPQIAGVPGAPAAPAADMAPQPEPAPQHDVLLEPAAVPAASPDAGAAPAAETPAPPPGKLDEAAPQVIAPDAPLAVTPGADTLPKPPGTSTLQDAKPSTLPSSGNLIDRAKAGKTGQLPQIGQGLDKAASLPDTKSAGLPQIGVATATPDAAVPAADAPLRAYARAFAPPDPSRPRFAILLRDIGDQGMATEDLLKLPFPLTIVLDPLAPDATSRMEAWRAAGQEVVMAAAGLPQGASAADVAQTFQALSATLPEAVAVIDATSTMFQNDRPLASLVVPEIQSGGRGLVTWDSGLDAADQIAQRSGLAAARIFRRLDGSGESKETIRRYLDRSAFKAAQQGWVVVLGDTRPDTVAAILEWTVEGKANGVNLAPLSAVLATPK